MSSWSSIWHAVKNNNSSLLVLLSSSKIQQFMGVWLRKLFSWAFGLQPCSVVDTGQFWPGLFKTSGSKSGSGSNSKHVPSLFLYSVLLNEKCHNICFLHPCYAWPNPATDLLGPVPDPDIFWALFRIRIFLSRFPNPDLLGLVSAPEQKVPAHTYYKYIFFQLGLHRRTENKTALTVDYILSR